MKNKIGIIEIVSSDASLGCLKKSEIKNPIICLPLELSYGDLSDLENYNRNCLENLYDSCHYIPFERNFNFSNEFKLLESYVNSSQKIRIWASHLDANEYCLLLYLCYCFPNENISVVFSEEFNWHCKSIGMMSSEEITELLNREHNLCKEEIDDYCRQWEEVLEANSDLRYLVNGKVKNESIDYFDDEIIYRLKKSGEVNLYTFITDLILDDVINNSSDTLYKFLIEKLIKQKKIVIREENEIKYLKLVN